MITYTYDVRLPDYSLPYLINGDDSGLTPQDKKIIDHYMEDYYSMASRINGQVIIEVESMEGYFTHSPAFGLPCNVYDSIILVMKS